MAAAQGLVVVPADTSGRRKLGVCLQPIALVLQPLPGDGLSEMTPNDQQPRTKCTEAVVQRVHGRVAADNSNSGPR